MSLENVGAFHNYPKLKLEKIDGKPEKYWKQNMDLLLSTHPQKFEEYAKRDPEIALLAFKKLYDEYARKGIDIHRYPTLPSATLADFRLNFLGESPYPTNEVFELAHQKRRSGWVKTKRRKIVFDGDMNVRLFSVRCLWGAINSAYIRGLRTSEKPPDMIDIDVSHLYPTATVTQPLPVKSTKYIKFDNWEIAKTLEGWCKVEFEYPEKFMYPCLPVRHPLIPRLIFPRKDVSYCTLHEVRVAEKFGLKIHSIEGYGFKPSKPEINHPLKPFFQQKMKKKSSIKRGTPEYAQVKGELVMTVGKFGEKGTYYPVNVLQDIITHLDNIEDFRKLMSQKKTREKFKRKIEVGKGWFPEWYSLILGRSRSIMAELIPYGCLTVSTDGGVWLKDGWQKIQNLPFYKHLKNVGSGIRVNTELNSLCEIRSRLGVGWLKDKPVFEHRHGVHIKKNYGDWENDLFIHLTKLFIKAKRQTVFNYVSKRLTSVKDDLLKGTGLFTEEFHVQKLGIEWKHQRKIYETKIFENPFIGWCWTYPYENVEEALKDELRGQPEPVRGKPKRIPEEVIELIMKSDLPSKKLSEQILEEYGVKVSASMIRKKRSGIRDLDWNPTRYVSQV